jgi:site-specific DNA-cytosine methylase
VRVLVACEFSGVVSQAFRDRGHEAWSCDLLPSPNPFHVQGDVRELLGKEWDLLIAHPPCTALCVSGNRHYAGSQERLDAAEFFRVFLEAPIERICVENPVGVVSTLLKKASQYIQPWQFGHGETKKTGLWLKNLPLLTPTNIVEGREQRIWRMAPSPDRGLLRSITYQGIANAMANQWG